MDMNKAISASMECYRTCTQTKAHCLEMGGDHAEPGHINLLADCAKICITSADLMLRESDFHMEMCALCAEVCDACALECDVFEEDFMRDCAAACRKCAEECREMVTGPTE